MPHKGRKQPKRRENGGRRSQNGNKKKQIVESSPKSQNSETLTTYFKHEELQQIRSSLTTPDLSGTPLVVAAAILNKSEMLKKLLRQGRNVNETGENNMTALMWAVRHKNLNVIELLLNRGADPSVATEAGDTILFQALENKCWEEGEFLSLWKRVEKVQLVDVDYVGRSTRSMLHLAVRRGWCEVIDELIGAKVNVNTRNITGGTPLMAACYYNHVDIAFSLLQVDADPFLEDNKNYTALHYAILCATIRKLEKPHVIVDLLLEELGKSNVSFLDFIKEKLESPNDNTEKQSKIKAAANDMKRTLILYTLKWVRNGARVLLELDVFQKIVQSMTENIRDGRQIKKWLALLVDILPHLLGCGEIILDDVLSNGLNACLLALKQYGLDKNSDWVVLALYPIVEVTVRDPGNEWLREHYEEVAYFYAKHLEGRLEEVDSQMHESILKFLVIMNGLRRDLPTSRLAEKLGSKKKGIVRHQTCVSEVSAIRKPGAKALGKLLSQTAAENSSESASDNGWPTHLSWDLFRPEPSSSDSTLRTQGSCEIVSSLKRTIEPFAPTADETRPASNEHVRRYLSAILEKILTKYQNHWNADRKHQMMQEELKLQKQEIYTLNLVKHEFNELMDCLSQRNPNKSVTNAVESMLLGHKIRGNTVMDDLEPRLFCSGRGDENLSCFGCLVEEKFVPPTTAGTLKGEGRRGCTMQFPYHLVPGIMALCEDISDHGDVPSKNLSPVRSRRLKLAGSLVDMAPESAERRKVLVKESKSLSNFEERHHVWIMPNNSRATPERCPDMLHNTSGYKFPTYTAEFPSNYFIPSDPPIGVEPRTQDNFRGSKWRIAIRSLQIMADKQLLFNGDIRISCKEERDSHLIAAGGGNFGAIELGLDQSDHPLAIKRITKTHAVCKTLKFLLNPMLGLRSAHLLHYFSCNYENEELILATPLCEYNVSEYLVRSRTACGGAIKVTPVEIVKQFLMGIRFLHERAEPIVHGNLKPSNILIDTNGVVRVAEFGMHKALFRLTAASDTSIIWFARETFAAFRDTEALECSCASDIQVAGMLVHFVLTAGKHPYGEQMAEILKNLEKSLPQLVTNDMDLHDLITWMLLHEPGDRPTINQVLSHVFFWTGDRKWRFLLTCAGISSHGTPLNLPLKELHEHIQEVATRDNIRGRWISTTRFRFPTISPIPKAEDSVVGLLRFVRTCVQNQASPNSAVSDCDLCDFILSTFPALPLSLYRILESSAWLRHCAFEPFTAVDSLSV